MHVSWFNSVRKRMDVFNKMILDKTKKVNQNIKWNISGPGLEVYVKKISKILFSLFASDLNKSEHFTRALCQNYCCQDL